MQPHAWISCAYCDSWVWANRAAKLVNWRCGRPWSWGHIHHTGTQQGQWVKSVAPRSQLSTVSTRNDGWNGSTFARKAWKYEHQHWGWTDGGRQVVWDEEKLDDDDDQWRQHVEAVLKTSWSSLPESVQRALGPAVEPKPEPQRRTPMVRMSSPESSSMATVSSEIWDRRKSSLRPSWIRQRSKCNVQRNMRPKWNVTWNLSKRSWTQPRRTWSESPASMPSRGMRQNSKTKRSSLPISWCRPSVRPVLTEYTRCWKVRCRRRTCARCCKSWVHRRMRLNKNDGERKMTSPWKLNSRRGNRPTVRATSSLRGDGFEFQRPHGKWVSLKFFWRMSLALAGAPKPYSTFVSQMRLASLCMSLAYQSTTSPRMVFGRLRNAKSAWRGG